MRRTALVLTAVFLSLFIPGLTFSPFHLAPEVARADPVLSVALSPEVPNGDFTLGTTNVGTPPANNNFSSGTTASWTVSGTNSVLSGGPSGHYLELTGGKAMSSPFTVDLNAKAITLKVSTSSSTAQVKYYVDGTAAIGYLNCPCAAGWITVQLNAASFLGQPIQLSVAAGGGAVDFTDMAVQVSAVPGWSAPGGALPPTISSQNGLQFLNGLSSVTTDALNVVANATAWFHVCTRIPAGTVTITPSTGPTPSALSGTNSWTDNYFSVAPTGNTVTLTFASSGGGNTPPDIGCLERVDGPAQNKVLGSNMAGALPSGLGGNTVDSLVGLSTDPVSGAFMGAASDIGLPTYGVPLAFLRLYSSAAVVEQGGSTGVLGAKWSHNWQMRIDATASAVIIRLPGGVSENWYWNGATSYYPPPGVFGSLTAPTLNGPWTLITTNQLTYYFDSSGRWISVSDRNNNVTSLGYDGNGRLTTITGANGRALSLAYDGNGRISSASDGTGRSVSYGYDVTNGDLTQVTNVMGTNTSYLYSGHRITRVTNPRGNYTATNTYDASGRVSTQTDALGGLITFGYANPGAGATRITDQRGNNSTVYFDTSLRVTDGKTAAGNVWSTTYDASSNALSVIDPIAHSWQYSYDANGNALSATDPMYKQTTASYTWRNDPATLSDQLAKTTTLGYNGNGSLQSVTDPANKTKALNPSFHGLPTSITDKLGHTTSYGYDSFGNVTSVTDPLSHATTISYDSRGRATSVTDALSHAATETYNNVNRPLTVTDAVGHVTTLTYDADGNLASVTDANSKTTSYTYDVLDRLTATTDAANGTTTFAYDAVGNVTSKTDPRGKTTTYLYNSENRLTRETDPLGNQRNYAYDNSGRLTSRTDAKNQTTTYGYSTRNQLTQVTYPNSTTVTFTYNDHGDRTGMTDSTGTTSYTYDNLYRVTSVTFPGSRTVDYAYDDAGRRTSVTYANGAGTVSYAYDAANRMTTVTDLDSLQTAYAYDNANRLTTTTLPNGVVSTASYDNANRLLSISHVKGATALASVSYTLDAVGNRTQRVDDQGTQTYVYDNLNRLTSVTYPGPSTTTYGFDAFSNRTSMTTGAGTTTYAYDNASRLTSVTPPSPAPVVSYTWDNNGNLTQRGSDTFSWDFEDRMTSATVGGNTSTFTYRGDGLRNTRVSGGVTSTFTWDLRTSQVLDDGASQYVYGAGLISQKTGANKFYYLADGLGSTMKTTDASGNVVNTYTYDVYGKVLTSTGSQVNDRQFAGEQTDATGLQYLRHRYYDPSTGTFISRDPMAGRPRWSRSHYGYAGANPVNATDPSGLVECEGTCADDTVVYSPPPDPVTLVDPDPSAAPADPDPSAAPVDPDPPASPADPVVSSMPPEPSAPGIPQQGPPPVGGSPGPGVPPAPPPTGEGHPPCVDACLTQVVGVSTLIVAGVAAHNYFPVFGGIFALIAIMQSHSEPQSTTTSIGTFFLPPPLGGPPEPPPGGSVIS